MKLNLKYRNVSCLLAEAAESDELALSHVDSDVCELQ
jgi:hypothetical protein